MITTILLVAAVGSYFLGRKNGFDSAKAAIQHVAPAIKLVGFGEGVRAADEFLFENFEDLKASHELGVLKDVLPILRHY